jgi:hypothetical protein
MSFPIHLLTPSSSQPSTSLNALVLNVFKGLGLQAPGFAAGRQRSAEQLDQSGRGSIDPLLRWTVIGLYNYRREEYTFPSARGAASKR